MPAMTIAELHKWIAEHFPHAPADVQIEHLDDTTIRLRQARTKGFPEFSSSCLTVTPLDKASD
jgi:hypothetical protein